MLIRRVWAKLKSIDSFGGGIALTAITNIVIALLGLMTGIIAARLLGPVGRGELRAVQTWPNFLLLVAALGLPEALVYFTARNPKGARSYLCSSVLLVLLLMIPFLLLGFYLLPVLLSAQSDEVVQISRWYLLLVPALALIALPTYCLRGLERFASWNVVRTLPNLGWLVVLLAAVLLAERSLWFLTIGHLILMVSLAFPILLFVIRASAGSLHPDKRDWKPLMKYGLPSMLSGVPGTLNLRIDQMAMAAWLPPHFLGLYAVASAWSSGVSPLLVAVGSVLFPRVASERNREEQVRLFAQGIRLAVLLTLVITPVVLLATPWILPLLFGAEFSGSVAPALILVVASAVSGINRVLEEGLRGLGRPSAVMNAEFFGLVVICLGLVMLLVPFDVVGAAFASIIGYLAILAVLVFQARKLTGCSASELLRPAGSDLAVAWRRLAAMARAVRNEMERGEST